MAIKAAGDATDANARRQMEEVEVLRSELATAREEAAGATAAAAAVAAVAAARASLDDARDRAGADTEALRAQLTTVRVEAAAAAEAAVAVEVKLSSAARNVAAASGDEARALANVNLAKALASAAALRAQVTVVGRHSRPKQNPTKSQLVRRFDHERRRPDKRICFRVCVSRSRADPSQL